jgi:hemerythrin superfamily protein
LDIREQLRRDHAKALAELAAVGNEADERRAQARLARLRHAWMLHALAEETVVYRALEGVQATHHADDRFVEHELVDAQFQKLAQGRVGTHEWKARINVLLEVMTRHIHAEEGGLFVNLVERYSAEELVEMGNRFVMARDKLAMLEAAKKAA